jgi:hypothetical protein
MSAVLGLIQELAVLKRTRCGLVTVEDLVRDGFGQNHYFMFCCRNRKKTTQLPNKS